MLTKHKEFRPQKGVESPLKYVFMSAAYSTFFRKGASNFDIFSSAVFSGRIILKHIENQKGFRGSRGMLPWKIFKKLHTVVAILILFEQFVGKLLNFSPKSECFTKYGTFNSYIFDHACLRRKAYYQRGSKLWKNCIHQKHV